jgi:hypothetical protein
MVDSVSQLQAWALRYRADVGRWNVLPTGSIRAGFRAARLPARL